MFNLLYSTRQSMGDKKKNKNLILTCRIRIAKNLISRRELWLSLKCRPKYYITSRTTWCLMYVRYAKPADSPTGEREREREGSWDTHAHYITTTLPFSFYITLAICRRTRCQPVDYFCIVTAPPLHIIIPVHALTPPPTHARCTA